MSLISCALLWILIKTSERKDQEVKKSYRLESTQNYIFSLFIRWMKSDYKNYEFKENKRIIKFSKDDLINFLITRYNYLRKALQGTERLSDFEIVEKIRGYEKNDTIKYERTAPAIINILNIYMPTPGEIDLEIAQLISDLIINRLQAKGAIVKRDVKKLSDYYEYEDNDGI